MMTSLSRYIKTLLAVTFAGAVISSCTDDIDAPSLKEPISEYGDFGIGFRCTEMVETFFGSHNPASRASDPKETEEKEIKSIHIFFFDPVSGALLEPADYDNFTSYMYREKTEKVGEGEKSVNPSFLSIPFSAGEDGKNTVVLFTNLPDNFDGKVKVVAIANIDAVDGGVNMFKTKFEYNPSGDIREEGRSETKFNSEEENPVLVVENYSDLQKWIYFPPIRMGEDGVSGRIEKLPTSGMPMIGEEVINILEKSSETPVIKMRALMAKVNVSIELDPNQYTSQYPLLTITEYGVRNMPIAVPFEMPTAEPIGGGAHFKPSSYTDYVQNYDITKVPIYHRTDVSELLPDPIHYECEDAAHEFTTKVNITLNKDSDPFTFHYYTFENIQLPNYSAKLANGDDAFDGDLNPVYPKKKDNPNELAIKEEDKQRWKSTFAYSDRASALILKGRYTTHQGITYNAEFTVYMGQDADIDFQVKRNHQYDNNIVIHGLDYIRNSADNVYNFDGRVNVYDTENPLYLAIVNELKVDAHASALPMDVWLMLRENGTYNESTPAVDHYTEVKFSIPVEDQDWIQMVLIPREEMETPNEKGEIFTAGRGAEKYFYKYLIDDIKSKKVFQAGAENGAYPGHYLEVTNHGTGQKVSTVTVGGKSYPVGAQCGREVTVFSTEGDNGGDINNSRSRIYFYIDENVDGGDRSTTVLVEYKSFKIDEAGQETDVKTFTRTVDIAQRGLLPVSGQHPTENVNIPETYMEYYEEYLEHNDPLDRHEQPGEYYTGLQWGFDGQTLLFNGNWFTNPEGGRNFQIYNKEGAYYITRYMVNRRDTDDLDAVYLFNEKVPSTIFHYCYGKNKRNYDGSPAVSYSEQTNWIGQVTSYTGTGWYAPGIRELEKAIVEYYELFPEFRGNWYWSASAAREGDIWGQAASGDTNSRATKVTLNGTTPTFVPSESADDEGCKPRTDFYRVRTFYRKN